MLGSGVLLRSVGSGVLLRSVGSGVLLRSVGSGMLLRSVVRSCNVWMGSVRLGVAGASASLAGYHVIVKPILCRHSASCKQSSVLVRTSLQTRTHDQNLQFDWWMLLEFVSPDLLLLSVAVVSALACALLNIAIPLELGGVVNVVSNLRAGQDLRGYMRELLPHGARLAILYASQGLLTSVYIAVLSVVGERVAFRLRTALFHSLLQQDIAFFDQHKTGELVSRLSGDVQDLKSSFKMVISQGLRGSAQLMGCAISLYYISPQMTAVVGVAVPVMVAVGTVIGSVLRKLSRRAQEQVAIATGVADEALSNVRTVRAFAMEPSEESLYSKELTASVRDNERLGLGIAIFQGLSNFAINGMVLAVISHGGVLLASNQITPGQLMSFLVATQTIQKSLGTLSVLFSQVVRGMSAGARVFQYMHTHPAVSLCGGSRLTSVQGTITLDHVSFSYPSRAEQTVLDELTLDLPAGQVTALCGLSGAGKSTVAALLERFYEPTDGAILLDGVPLSMLDPSWLRGNVIGYISQEPVLFAATVAENIRYSRPAASEEEVIAAAKLANAHQFIEEFPEGYSTVLGERGVTLSGGQKQRVAIARAVLKDPQVIILDEATSALDAHSESLVQEALDRACQGRTVLVIAHRLSTIRNAHQIVVLHKGRLREVGTHSELMAKGKFYKELIRRQTALE